MLKNKSALSPILTINKINKNKQNFNTFFFIRTFFEDKRYKNNKSINSIFRFSAKFPIKIDIGTITINNSKNLFISRYFLILK